MERIKKEDDIYAEKLIDFVRNSGKDGTSVHTREETGMSFLFVPAG